MRDFFDRAAERIAPAGGSEAIAAAPPPGLPDAILDDPFADEVIDAPAWPDPRAAPRAAVVAVEPEGSESPRAASAISPPATAPVEPPAVASRPVTVFEAVGPVKPANAATESDRHDMGPVPPIPSPASDNPAASAPPPGAVEPVEPVPVAPPEDTTDPEAQRTAPAVEPPAPAEALAMADDFMRSAIQQVVPADAPRSVPDRPAPPVPAASGESPTVVIDKLTVEVVSERPPAAAQPKPRRYPRASAGIPSRRLSSWGS